MVLIPNNLPNQPNQTNQSSQQLSLNTATTNTSLNRLFSLGQVLTANIQPINQSEVKLSVAGQTFTAQTKTPITESGTVQVKVKQLTPELQLSIIKSPNIDNKSTQQALLQAAYRQFIPSQMPLSQTFQQINLLQSLPPNVQIQLQNLLNQLLRQDNNLDGKALKQKLIDSGLFMEARLKQTPVNAIQQNLKSDVKSQLLQLQSQVNNQIHSASASSSLNKLSELLSQALSRITVQQLQLLENPNITALMQLYEQKALFTEDRIEIHRRDQGDEKSWEIYINLNLDQGEWVSKLVLNEDNTLRCFIWCETESLKKLVEANLQQLQTNLEQQDFKQVQLQLVPQKIEKSKESIKVALIDIKV